MKWIYFIAIIAISYKPPYMKDFDYKSLAKFVKRVEKPNEPILFYNKALAFTFKYYYQGNNLYNPLPEWISDHSYYECNVMDTINIINSIRETEKFSESLLLITAFDPGLIDSTGLTLNSSEVFLDNNYNFSVDTIFNGEMDYAKLRIRRFYLKAK